MLKAAGTSRSRGTRSSCRFKVLSLHLGGGQCCGLSHLSSVMLPQGCRRLCQYTFRVCAIGKPSSDGSVFRGPFSNDSKPAVLPGIFKPRSVSAAASAENLNSFNVSWDATQAWGTLVVTSYCVQYMREGEQEGELCKACGTEAGASRLSCVVPQCQRGSEYRFRVIAAGENSIVSMPSEWSAPCFLPYLTTPARPVAERSPETNQKLEIEVIWFRSAPTMHRFSKIDMKCGPCCAGEMGGGSGARSVLFERI